MIFNPKKAQETEGFTLVETSVAAMVIALFLGSMFAFNSSCLSLVRNAKDSSAAMLSNQQRVEELRSCNWSEITDQNYVSTSVMTHATQTGAALTNATEVVRITENGFVQGASAAYIEVTRTPSQTTVTAQNLATNLLTARLLKVDLSLAWQTLGGRSRSRASTTVIARGGLTINETTTIAPTVNW